MLDEEEGEMGPDAEKRAQAFIKRVTARTVGREVMLVEKTRGAWGGGGNIKVKKEATGCVLNEIRRLLRGAREIS